MAWVYYNTAKENQADGNAVNLDAAGDVIKCDIVTSAYVPNIDTDEARNATNEVATGTTYSAGGPTLANQTVTVDTVNDRIEWDFDDVTIGQDASGFTNGRIARLYKNAGNYLCYADLGGDKSIQGGDLTLQIDPDGALNW